MKKLILVAAVVAVGFSSCKKDYTCSCTVTNSGVSGTGTSTYHDTKKNAKSSCESKNGTSNGTTTTCTLN